ncbi:uncharacterized protein LOC122848459 [Aphidius gifuensis]|uniref:uncharacterized protein LOC122848459 n=1 Tax=Aphidius gifuensis TaxID=684658 RepID=UPI001CDD2C85|nr:uncharacterized protein LOC122848459 [Aphidius gifuensis]
MSSIPSTSTSSLPTPTPTPASTPPPPPPAPSAPRDIFRNSGVAKKSTTKQILQRASIKPKNTARKSTTHRPSWYSSGTTCDIDDADESSSSSFSFYGKPIDPIDLESLNTIMTLGHAQIKVKCSNMTQYFSIDPRVLVEDVVLSGRFISNQ